VELFWVKINLIGEYPYPANLCKKNMCMMNLNLKINPKEPHPPYESGSSFWWEDTSTHPDSTCKPINNLHPNTKFVEFCVDFIKNVSFFSRNLRQSDL